MTEPNFKYQWLLVMRAINKRPEGIENGGTRLRPKVRKKMEHFCDIVWDYYMREHNRRTLFFRDEAGLYVTDASDRYCQTPFLRFSLDEPI